MIKLLLQTQVQLKLLTQVMPTTHSPVQEQGVTRQAHGSCPMGGGSHFTLREAPVRSVKGE